LIALDYGPTAQKVAETGYLLAKTMGAEITLLHVLSEPVYYSSPEYSPIMGFNGFMAMDSLKLNDVGVLKKHLWFFLKNQNNILVIKPLKQ